MDSLLIAKRQITKASRRQEIIKEIEDRVGNVNIHINRNLRRERKKKYQMTEKKRKNDNQKISS